MGVQPNKSRGRDPSPLSPRLQKQQNQQQQQKKKTNESDTKLTDRKFLKKREEVKSKSPHKEDKQKEKSKSSPVNRKNELSLSSKLLSPDLKKAIRLRPPHKNDSQVSLAAKPLFKKVIPYNSETAKDLKLCEQTKTKHKKKDDELDSNQNADGSKWWRRLITHEAHHGLVKDEVEPTNVFSLRNIISNRFKSFTSRPSDDSSTSDSTKSVNEKGKGKSKEKEIKKSLATKTTQESESKKFTDRLHFGSRRQSADDENSASHPSPLKLMVRKVLWKAVGKPYMKRNERWNKLLQENNVDIDKINIDALDISLINVDQLGIENKALKNSVIWLLK